MWGVAAAVLNLVPFLGSIVISGAAAVMGFLQMGTLGVALLIGGVSLFIHTLSGNLLTPWLTSRASRMNPVVIFVGVLAWGWLWGIWGLLLGAPLLMVPKTVCERVEDLRPIGELRVGVCRGCAQLVTSWCRAVNIAAYFANGPQSAWPSSPCPRLLVVPDGASSTLRAQHRSAPPMRGHVVDGRAR